MKPVTQKHGTHSDGTLPDGVCLTEDLDGVLDVDSKQLMIGLSFQELETTQILKEEYKSQDQPWKELDSHHLESHALLIQHSALTDLTHPTGLESTWTLKLATSTDNSISQWHLKTQMLSSSLLGYKPTQETHGKKLIFSTFTEMEKPNRTCFQLQSCNHMTSWEMQMQPTQAQ